MSKAENLSALLMGRDIFMAVTEKMNISFSPPDIGESEIQEVAEALRSGWITTGPRTKKLEKLVAELKWLD